MAYVWYQGRDGADVVDVHPLGVGPLALRYWSQRKVVADGQQTKAG
jgi:hypothetical protein